MTPGCYTSSMARINSVSEPRHLFLRGEHSFDHFSME
jgi:hypothetical protein